ncbi:HNH endonuclease [Luteimonas sp. FCS-9]|uniref:HNH endonuclease n=1 Tax=Luteimonas sp. FCS-9 TaxID=1547516 RepID=UPI0012E05982|nr:HNH endonuclease [Luteimonas sp. FCS-9]
MKVFRYPQERHVRSYKPKKFKRYQTYKKFVRREFQRTCVYCRQPDSSAPNLNFGVDHFRPKADSRFAALLNEYSNLYYCCAGCNSRKGNYWPATPAEPMFVNPCDDVMSRHLKFEAASGEIKALSDSGLHMEELLELNSPENVAYRRSTLRIMSLIESQIATLLSERTKFEDALRRSGPNTAVSEALNDIEAELQELRLDLSRQNGSAPLPPVRNTVLGVTVAS